MKITLDSRNFFPYAGIVIWTVHGALMAAQDHWLKAGVDAVVCLLLLYMTCLPAKDEA